MQTYAHFAVLCQCTMVYMKDLRYHNRPITFTLQGKQIRSMDLTTLGIQLHQMEFTKRLTVLDLSRNLIAADGISVLMEKIVIKVPSLTDLNLNENPYLGDVGVKTIIPYLSKCQIKRLHLARCGLNDDSARYFREAKIPSQLAVVDFSGNLLTDGGAVHLVRTMKHAKHYKGKASQAVS